MVNSYGDSTIRYTTAPILSNILNGSTCLLPQSHYPSHRNDLQKYIASHLKTRVLFIYFLQVAYFVFLVPLPTSF